MNEIKKKVRNINVIMCKDYESFMQLKYSIIIENCGVDIFRDRLT